MYSFSTTPRFFRPVYMGIRKKPVLKSKSFCWGNWIGICGFGTFWWIRHERSESVINCISGKTIVWLRKSSTIPPLVDGRCVSCSTENTMSLRSCCMAWARLRCRVRLHVKWSRKTKNVIRRSLPAMKELLLPRQPVCILVVSWWSAWKSKESILLISPCTLA